jgi:hypothetical protein
MKCRPIQSAYFLSIPITFLIIATCVTAASNADIPGSFAYQPVPSPTRIDASASVEATHEVAPAARAAWKAGGHKDQASESFGRAVAEALTADVGNSGLFARIVPANGSVRPDFLLRIRSEIIRAPDLRLRLTISVINGATGADICLHMREASIGKGRSMDSTMSVAMPRLMAELKAAVAADLQPKVRAAAERSEMASLANASLADLFVSSDSTESIARQRNRAIIAAENQQLPALLRDKKTDELSALVVKIEQTILDLDHECEVAKGQVQQSAADSGAPGMASPAAKSTSLDELRGLAICYRERIELLKPIAAALKEEIANRNR